MPQTLRSKLIRLAHAKPELQQHLLPLLAKQADEDDGDKEAKAMYDVKEKGPKYTTNQKVDKARDPHAKALSMGQFQSKMVPSKKHKDPKYKGRNDD
jgi:hypothetical protein